MLGYSMDVNNDRGHVATGYFACKQAFPEAGPSPDPPLVAVPHVMMHRYGHRQTTGSIGDQLAMSIESQTLGLDGKGVMRDMWSNWIERDEAKARDDMLGMYDDEMDKDDEDGEAGGRLRKKPRNSLRRGTACVRCRSKKLKCTGERPVCSACQNSRKPVECVYQPMAKRKPKTHRLRLRLQELEDQIKEKESQLRRLDEPLPDTPSVTQAKLGLTSEESGARLGQVVPSSDLFRSRDKKEALKYGSNSVCMVTLGGQTTASFRLSDQERPNAKDLVQTLTSAGKHVVIISRDLVGPVERMANKLGITSDNMYSRCATAQKLGIIRKLQEGGKKVCYVSDGANDAVALAASDISVAIGEVPT